MMSKQIKIPPSEWIVMEILWDEAPLSAAEIAERLPEENPVTEEWNTKTIRSFLDRLLQKDAVSRRKIHGMFVFEPLVKREDSLRQEGRSFIDRFFYGSTMLTIQHFVENEAMSEIEIKRLKQLLDHKDQGKSE